MGRFWLQFDPPGYKYASEPGIDFLIDGPGLLEKFAADPEPRARNFWNPPGSQWLMCRPRQFSPEWYRDLRLADHVLRAASWTWASGISPVEYEPSRDVGASYPDNQWISIHVPDEVASLDSRNYAAMLAAAQIDLPSNLVTIGFCGQAPSGQGFSEEPSQLHPYFQWLHYPAPNDVFVFGFAQIAVIASRDTYTVLRTPDNGESWIFLGQKSLVGDKTPLTEKAQPFLGGSVVQATAPRPDARSLLLHPAGFNDLFAVPSAGQIAGFTLRYLPPGSGEPLLTAGPFWVAAMPGQRLSFQAQIVGYELADSRDPADPAPQPWINLGEFYKPSVAPKFMADSLIWVVQGGAPPETTINPDGTITVASPDLDPSITYGLLDETGTPWDFNAAATYQGSMFLTLGPGWFNGEPGGFLSPQVRHLEFRFPVVLTERDNDLLELDDSEFGVLTAEAYVRDPLGKRLRIELLDAGLAKLSASGHDRRANYPIHVVEDTDGDNVPDTVRVRAWLKRFEVREYHAADPVTGEPVQAYEIEAHGLLSRADQKYLYLPQMVDPEAIPPGTVEHTFAVRTSLQQSGFDVEDPSIYVEQTDPLAGTEIAQLPGTWARKPGVIGRVTGNVWGPTWKQTKLDYCLEIAHKLRGWVLYETLDGVIHYHEDLLRDLERGAQYAVSARLYATSAEAANAGVARQIYLADSRLENEEPEANIVRVSGEDESLAITPQVLERDGLSITDINYEHYLGEPVVYSVEPRQATDLGTMQVLCRLLVERLCRRRFRRQVESEIAPWEALPEALELAHVLRLGGRGDFFITHLGWRLLKSHSTAPLYETTFTLVSLPANASEGTGSGDYPGRAADIDA